MNESMCHKIGIFNCGVNGTELFLRETYGTGYSLVIVFTVIWLTLCYTIIFKTICRHITLRGPTIIPLPFLAAFDLLFSIFQVICFCMITYMSHSYSTMRLFGIMSFFVLSSFLNSTMIVMLITVNQFLTSINVHNKVTRKMLYVAIAITITVSYAFYVLVHMMGYIIVLFVVIISHNIIAMSFMMGYTFYTSRKRLKDLISRMINDDRANHDLNAVSEKQGNARCSVAIIRSEQAKEKKDLLKTRKHLAGMSLITLLFLCTIVSICIRRVTSGFYHTDVQMTMIIICLYTAMNPIIYMGTITKLRFFVQRDYKTWMENNAISCGHFRRSRAVNPGTWLVNISSSTQSVHLVWIDYRWIATKTINSKTRYTQFIILIVVQWVSSTVNWYYIKWN